jgi:5-methylcytosine-specific restriction endonuclease McrA
MAPKYSPRRRAIYKQGENINRVEVYQRDNWVCRLCGYVIDSTLRFPDEMAATLDHITPLALGGTHTYENVAAAHARCNFLKGCNTY